ncbi:unnamed protein product [marine sediment metagenome]|uniref:Uncharacterized protein n=1 Tax=marine sediment metagenome TaxID=412755 RepID=X1DWX7_9ZZZZ
MKKQKGFTLIEILIYSALLGIFLGGVVILVGNIFASTDTTLARSEVLTNQEFIERKLQWLTGQATDIISPVPGSASTQLELSEPVPGIHPAIFSLDATTDQLLLSLGGGTPLSLTNNRVEVIDFIVEHFVQDGSLSTIRISLGLQSALYHHIISTTTLIYALPY